MDLTEGVIWRRLLVFSIPILLCNLFQQLYNTVDAAILGGFVGSDAIAAVGSTGSLISLLVGFFLGLSSGASVVVARHWGAKDDDISPSVHTSMVLGIACGVLLTVLGIALCVPLLRLMKSPEEVIGLSATYLRIYFAGMVPSMIYNIGAGILRAVGDSRRPLIYLVISGVANFLLDFLFVVGFNWSVAGAAFATVLSQILSAVLVVIQLMTTGLGYKLELKKLRVNFRLLWSIVRIGVPAGLQSMMYAISNILIQTNINTFGADAMAGCAAYGKIDGFMYMPLNSFGLAATTFTGQNMGADKPDRVRKGARAGILMGLVSSVSMGLIVVLTGERLMTVLTGGNLEAVRYGVTMMWIMAIFEWTFVPTEILCGVIRGAGSAFVSTCMTAVCVCVFRVVVITIFMPIVNDIRLVFALYPISWSICSAAFIIYYKLGHWMRRT